MINIETFYFGAIFNIEGLGDWKKKVNSSRLLNICGYFVSRIFCLRIWVGSIWLRTSNHAKELFLMHSTITRVISLRTTSILPPKTFLLVMIVRASATFEHILNRNCEREHLKWILNLLFKAKQHVSVTIFNNYSLIIFKHHIGH